MYVKISYNYQLKYIYYFKVNLYFYQHLMISIGIIKYVQ